jgi:hypothetical protein
VSWKIITSIFQMPEQFVVSDGILFDVADLLG